MTSLTTKIAAGLFLVAIVGIPVWHDLFRPDSPWIKECETLAPAIIDDVWTARILEEPIESYMKRTEILPPKGLTADHLPRPEQMVHDVVLSAYATKLAWFGTQKLYDQATSKCQSYWERERLLFGK